MCKYACKNTKIFLPGIHGSSDNAKSSLKNLCCNVRSDISFLKKCA